MSRLAIFLISLIIIPLAILYTLYARLPSQFDTCRTTYFHEINNSDSDARADGVDLHTQCYNNRIIIEKYQECITRIATNNKFPIAILHFIDNLDTIKKDHASKCPDDLLL